MIGWIEKQAWKIASAGLLILVISLGVALVRMTVDRNDTEKQRAALELSIEKPVTGWRSRLLTCQDNGERLKGAISDQNQRITDLGAASDAKIKEATKAVDAANKQSAKAEAKIKDLMRPLVGADTCLRVIEADERLLRSLQ